MIATTTAAALATCPPDYAGTAVALAIASAFTLAALAVPRTRRGLAQLLGDSNHDTNDNEQDKDN